MDAQKYDFIVSKTMYILVTLFGVILIFISGIFWGYTFKENEQYFYTDIREIQIVKYLNTKYTYNFIPNTDEKYGDKIAYRIMVITLFLFFIGIVLTETGNRMGYKYKYDKPFLVRLKNWYYRIKKYESESD